MSIFNDIVITEDDNSDQFAFAKFQEQDLRILKYIVSDQQIASDFVSSYEPEMFLGNSKKVGKAIFDYVKAFRATPTKRVLLDKYQKDSELCSDIEDLFEEISI